MEPEQEQEVISKKVAVVRWDQNDLGSPMPDEKAVVKFIESCGYKIGDRTRIAWCPIPLSDLEQFIFVPMESEIEAKRISDDSNTKGFALDQTVITFNLLVDVNGMRLQDLIDFMRVSQDQFESNDHLLEVLISMQCLEPAERLEVAEKGAARIEEEFKKLIQNSRCRFFGSICSNSRRTAYSDVDINVDSCDSTGNPASTNVRPLQQIIDNPQSIYANPLTKAELESFPPVEVIKCLFKCFNTNPSFKRDFEMRYIPARTPILVFKARRTDGLQMSFDVSINNQKGMEKASLLDEFIAKDKSKGPKMREVMMFLVLWARCNKLMPGVYLSEKLETKTNINSYIINQLIIHFVQHTAKKIMVQPQAAPGSRVVDYDFYQYFNDVPAFLQEFFKYYAIFDFSKNAIYGTQAMQKSTVSNAHNVRESPLMIIDPMDCTHNISGKVTEEGLRLLNGLLRNALYLLKVKTLQLTSLLQTNRAALTMMSLREPTINVLDRMPPDVFAGVPHREGRGYLSVRLPEVVQTSEEMMILLTRVLRYEVSANRVGPSVRELYNSLGVVFTIRMKTWIGRRLKTRQLKASRRDLSSLQAEVMISDVYQNEKTPVAEIRMVMCDIRGNPAKFLYIEMISGDSNDVKASLHYLIDQFLSNNKAELASSGGILRIAKIPHLKS